MKKKSVLLITITVLAMSLAACSSYVSSYIASAMVTSEWGGTASLSFWTFEGTKVLKLNNSSGSSAEVSYEAELESGSATVYYDDNGSKTEWFTINSGESLNGKAVPDKKGKIYVIIESDGKCENGSFDFKLN